MALAQRWWRVVALTLALLLASGVVLVDVHQHYPIQNWLILRYGVYWLLSLVFSASCVSFGFAALRLTLRGVLPVHEQIALAFPLGLLGFFLVSFIAGLLGLFGPVFFFAAPLLLLLVGAVPTVRYLRRLKRGVMRARRAPTLDRIGWADRVLPVLGIGALALIYFSILSPNNAGYDARWYHLGLAEQYASAREIFRFREGWVMGTYPQLASLMYAWAFQTPGALLFDKIELCAHLEFVTLLWRLAAIPPLVRLLIPTSFRKGRRAPYTWVAHFLFPGVFLYDSSLSLGAEHVAALWGAPIFLMLIRAYPRLDARYTLLLSAFIAGALLTKYTAALIVAFPILAVVGRFAWLLVSKLTKRAPSSGWVGMAVFAAGGLVLTAPHWLKNWVWYGDPLYPQLKGVLPLRPWAPEANIPYHWDIAVPWYATRDLEGLKETLRVTATFAFEHHDWAELHGKSPVFGFLFTVTVFCLPFLRKAPRLVALYVAGHFGVIVWCLISWQDRYLQVLVPWMASAVAATLILAWRLHVVTRLAAALLVVVQAAWGSDVYFFTTHRLIGSPHEAALRLINTGREKNYVDRFKVFDQMAKVGQALPNGAKPLIHESRQSFGMKHPRVNDRPGTQGFLYYSSMKSPREVYDKLRSLGVTHLVWGNPEGIETLASDLVFYDFATRRTRGRKGAAGYRIGELGEQPPTSTPFGRKVAVLGCGQPYAAGLYQLEDLAVSPFDPKRPFPPPRVPLSASTAKELAAQADFIVHEERCSDLKGTPTGFRFLTQRREGRLYVRNEAP